jgi:predicted acylesterase/phospholipase RssA
MNNKGKHRALVFQGGGALGAYEAGAFKSIYEYIIEREGVHAEENMFDVVAGTSIGAINATLLVDYVIKNETWRGSAEMLESFWNEFKAMTWADNPFFLAWWGWIANYLRKLVYLISRNCKKILVMGSTSVYSRYFWWRNTTSLCTEFRNN